MTTEQWLALLSQIPFIIIAGVTTFQAIRRPRRSTIDIAAFFVVIALIIINGIVAAELDVDDITAFTVSQVILLSVLPYLLLRVVNDLMDVPRSWQASATGALVLIVLAMVATGSSVPWWLAASIGLYYAVLGVYTTRAFLLGARAARGVTSRRLYAAASGSAFLGLTIVLVAAAAVLPALDGIITGSLTRMGSIAVGVSYFMAFSPPRFVRQFWQQPELRQILARVAVLPRLPSTDLIVQELQNGAAAATGAQGAAIGLYNAERDELTFKVNAQTIVRPATDLIAGRAFTAQQPLFSENAPGDDPAHADLYREFNAAAVLAAPITAGTERLGVLTVYASRPPVFADDDLQLVQLLADQAAVILESRALIDATTRLQAREQATLLRDEFLTAAAHDLRTPLTALIGRTQLIGRRAVRRPDVPIDPADIKLIENDLLRLNNLIGELLDTTRAEHGQLIGERIETDLVEIVQSACAHHEWNSHQCLIEAPASVVAEVDSARILQLLHNLIENALKYSPEGGQVRIGMTQEKDTAVLTVSDDGVGIPRDDLPNIFDRFHRAENVNRSHTAGLGLGLYICRVIVEEHGGTIEAQSTLGSGTTFTVTLPRLAEQQRDRTQGEGDAIPAPIAFHVNQ